MRLLIFALLCFLLFPENGSPATPLSLVRNGQMLKPGQTIAINLQRPASLPANVCLKLDEAGFAGATLLTRINGRLMPPWHAFGGDTRYHNVRGKPGLFPPVAPLEANYPLPPQWWDGKAGLTLHNQGPDAVRVNSMTVAPFEVAAAPRYQNSIYFDFDVWRQGYALQPGSNWFLESQFLGVIPGGGNWVMNYSGGDALPLKREAEEARIGWGFEHGQFYSIWHLVNTSKEWAKFVDVDKNPNTTGKFHTQFLNPAIVPAGADVVLMDEDKIFSILKPGIDALLPYSTYYNLTCEQWGPRGQGFAPARDRLQQQWREQGYGFREWADNYQRTYSRLAGYIHQQNPGAPVLSTQWWAPDIRFPLFDTALARGFPMSGMIDGLMTHYYSTPYPDKLAGGKEVLEEGRPENHYPGGLFDKNSSSMWRQYMGSWLQIPEIAIDFNRYRLSRTEKDIVPSIRQQYPTAGYWSNGEPLRYTAGFDGAEHIYNNETAIYDRNYSAPSPYQFLQAHFAYSLLPGARSEPRKLGVTRTLPLNPEAFPTQDTESTVEVPINLYGEWVNGAAHTQRLRTRDPIYGDMFGYTGFEYANSGDYIWLAGLRDAAHRRAPFDALSLVRRTCYAFVTAGEVYPAEVRGEGARHLFVKALVVPQGWREVVGVYAANFDNQPHELNILLPGWGNKSIPALLLDGAAGAWSDARPLQVTPDKEGQLHIQATLAAGSAWSWFLYPEPGQLRRGYGGASTPLVQDLPGEPRLRETTPLLRWAGGRPGSTYQLQVAREMLFRPQDLLLNLRTSQTQAQPKLPGPGRIHWRVRVAGPGVGSGWSRPRTMWIGQEKPEPAPAVPELPWPPGVPAPSLEPYTSPANLAWQGEYFAHGNYWQGPGKAVDGMKGSAWTSDAPLYDARRAIVPAWWAMRWSEERQIKVIRVLWAPDQEGQEVKLQHQVGKEWQDLAPLPASSEGESRYTLEQPLRTRALRVWIGKAGAKGIGIAEIYIGG